MLPNIELKEKAVYLILILAIIILYPLFAFLLNVEFSYLVAEQGFYQHNAFKFNQIAVTFLFLITETVSFPYGVATGAVLLVIMAKMLRFNYRQTFGLFLIVGLCILMGLLIKTGIKHLTSEPRPYLVWLSMLQDGIDFNLESYYEMSADAKEFQLLQVLNQSALEKWNIPNWLKDHWIKDKSYRFPSGHTFYAVFFVSFSALILPTKKYGVVFLLAIWAILVMKSRLFLGMHVPIDLFGGSIVAFLTSILAILTVKKILFTPYFMEKRD